VKYTTFRNIIVAGGLVSVVGAGLFFMSSRPGQTQPVVSSSPPAALAQPEPVRPPVERPALPAQSPSAAAPDPAPVPTPAKAMKSLDGKEKTPLRPMDDELLRLAGSHFTGDKVKDAIPGRPYKINLYVEGGRVVRAKVDLNRNEKWDEKWSFEIEGGAPVVKRQVSPTDDDASYPLKYRILNGAWVKESE
jgi:hypothetical protein